MSKRTQLSQAPTNFTDKQNDGSGSSCIVNKKRQMFQSLTGTNLQGVNMKNIVQQNGTQLLPKNLLVVNPNHVKSVIWPQIFMPGQQLTVSLRGNFYSIKDSRNKQRFINRNSMPYSQIMNFNVQKHGDKIIMSSVQKFIVKNENKFDELWYHFDVAIFNIETQSIQKHNSFQKGFVQASTAKTATNLSVKVGDIYYLEFKGMQLIDNNKKAFAVFEPIGLQRNRYQVIMIDFNKTKNNDSFQSMQDITGSKKYGGYLLQSKKVGLIHLQRKQTQDYKKLINSEYGDIVLLITSQQIYQIQIAGQLRHNQYTLILKPFMICKIFAQNKNTYVSNQTNQLVLSKQFFTKQEHIIDASYVMNGLKIMILTSHGRIFVVQSQQCIFSQSLYEMLSNKQMVQNYNIEYFVFKTIYFLRGLLVVQVEAQKKSDCNLLKQIKHQESILEKLDQKKNMFEYISRGLIISKVQSNSLSFSKFISLPFQLKQYESIKVHPFKQADQLLLQTINFKDQQNLQLYRCQIISNKNNFIPFACQHYLKESSINVIKENKSSNLSNKITRQVELKGLSKVTFGKSHKCFYILKGNEVSGYRIHSNQFVSILQNGIQKTLSVSFFEKPLKIITNPLTGQVVILFRQFIKFFMSVYSELKLLFVMNIRQAKDISFSRYGENFILTLADNSIYMIDSYKLNQHKIMEFYNDIKQTHNASQYIFVVKTTKNMLNIFRKKQKPSLVHNPKNNSQSLEFYDKLYELKLQNEDLYHVDQNNTVVLKKDGTLQFYSHIAQDQSIKSNTQEKQIIRLSLLSKEHPNLINKKKIHLQRQEHPTYCFYSSQFSTLFVGTNFGNIRQYLYPFLSIQDPSPPQCYTYGVTNNAITHIQINADFSSVYVINEMGQIIELKFEQYLNGLKKNGIYVLSKTQAFENQIKYEFANRNYLIDDYTSINDQSKRMINQQYEETCFVDDKIKNDIEDITNRIKQQSSKIITKLSSQKKSIQEEFKQEFNEISSKLKQQQKNITQKVQELEQNHNKRKQQMINQHEKQLLSIYKQNDRLKNILNSKTNQFNQVKNDLKEKLSIILTQQTNIKLKQTQRLQNQYQQLNNKYNVYNKTTNIQINQNIQQLQTFKYQEINKIQNKLKQQQLYKQSQLSKMGKIQKQIQRYKKRSIYFQNLIVQTNNQIQQLNNDVELYNQKKSQLVKQLNQKQITIQQKQTQIVKYLKTTNQMKKIKIVHQFQLIQFQNQIHPIQTKISQLQKQVQKMNFQIMDQFNSKVQQDSFIQSSNKRIQKLKNKNYAIVQDLLKSRAKLLRFTQSLASVLAQDPFALNVRHKLSKIIDNFSKEHQVFIPNQELQRGKKQGLNLMRKKNMLTKAIQREQKLEQGIVRNKNQFFRFYTDNTNLVKQYNELFKDHNILMREKNIIQQKIAALKVQMYKTPLKRTASLHIRKVSQKKLTPFQRYEQQQIQFNTIKLKQQDTTQTRLSRGQSSTFLKSLIKDVSTTQNSYQKSNIIRERIKTFINPQMQKKKQIQKQLFLKQRERGKSNHVPLLKL